MRSHIRNLSYLTHPWVPSGFSSTIEPLALRLSILAIPGDWYFTLSPVVCFVRMNTYDFPSMLVHWWGYPSSLLGIVLFKFQEQSSLMLNGHCSCWGSFYLLPIGDTKCSDRLAGELHISLELQKDQEGFDLSFHRTFGYFCLADLLFGLTVQFLPRCANLTRETEIA
nr:hypothetical protein Iba_chr13aCG3530 [Ipomoea batatas]